MKSTTLATYLALILTWISVVQGSLALAAISPPPKEGLYHHIVRKTSLTPFPSYLTKTHKLRIAFLTGIRALDGYGDLSLNKIFINQQIRNIKKKYGNNIQIHIVFMEEISNPLNKLSGLDGVKKVYDDDHFQLALQFFDKTKDTKGKPYLSLKDGLRFWKQDDFKNFIVNNPGAFDLALMVSELSQFYDNHLFYLPEWIKENLNTVVFPEYQQNLADNDFNILKSTLIENRNTDHAFLELKITAGVDSAGIILESNPSYFSKNQILDLIQKDLNFNENYFTNVLELETKKANHILKNDPWIIPSWLSNAEVYAGTNANKSVLMAFYHDQEIKRRNQGLNKKDYIVLSNMFENFQSIRSELMSLFKSDRRSKETNFEKEFIDFLNNRVLVLKFGSKPLPSEAILGIFNPENDSILAQTGGYASLGESLSVGQVPIIRPRNYHVPFIAALIEELKIIISKQHGPSMAIIAEDYFTMGKSPFVYDLPELVYLNTRLQPILRRAALKIRDEYNISKYTSDIIEAFYQAKTAEPNEKNLIFSILKSPIQLKNRFLTNLLNKEGYKNIGYLKCMEILEKDPLR